MREEENNLEEEVIEEKQEKNIEENKRVEEDKIEKEDKKNQEEREIEIEKNDSNEKKLKKVENKKKKMMFPIIIITALICCLIVFSVIFALININNEKILSGIKIMGIDVSNLKQQEAIQKLEEITQNKEIEDIILKYEDYETTINGKQFNII